MFAGWEDWTHLLTRLTHTTEGEQVSELVLALLETETELSSRVGQVVEVVDSDLLVLLYRHQRHHGASVAGHVGLPSTIRVTGMIDSGDPEIQVLGGFLGHLVAVLDGVDRHDPLQFVLGLSGTFLSLLVLRVKQLENLRAGVRYGKILKILPELIIAIVIIWILDKNRILLQDDGILADSPGGH